MNRITEAHIFVWRATIQCALRLFDSFNSETTKINYQFLIESKMNELEWSQHFSHYKSMGIFSIRSMAANSAVLCPIWPNFELIRDVMNTLVACKYEEDPIKNEGARAFTTFSPIINLCLV